MTTHDDKISAYVVKEMHPCRFCLKDIIDVQKPDGTYMKIDATTDPAKLELKKNPRTAHKALALATISPDLPEHKWAIAVAAQDLLEHLCPEGTNFRLGMKALAEDRRFEVRHRHELTSLGATGSDVPDPETYSEPHGLTRKILGPLDGTEGS